MPAWRNGDPIRPATGPDATPALRRGAPRSSHVLLIEFAGEHRGAILSWAVVTSIFLELVLGGGDRREVALAFVCGRSVLLSALLLWSLAAGRAFRLPRRTPEIGLAFAALIAVLLLQFLPAAHGSSVFEAWSAAGHGSSITLDRFATAVEVTKLIGLAVLFVTALLIATKKRDAEAALRAVLIEGSAYAAWALVGYYIPAFGVEISGDHRLLASLPTANVCAAFMGMLAVVAWNGALRSARRSREREPRGGPAILNWLRSGQAVQILLVLLALWDLSLTGSRGAALSTGLALIVTMLVWSLSEEDLHARFRALLLNVRMLLVVGLPAALAVNPLGARFALWGAGSDRSHYFQLYLAHLSQAPIPGFGLGTFKYYNAMLIKPAPGFWSWELGAMHNVYLQWIYEAGPLGAILLFAIIAMVIGVIVERLVSRRAGRTLPISAIGVSALLIVHGAIDIDLQVPVIAGLWSLLLGLAFASGGASGSRKPVDQ